LLWLRKLYERVEVLEQRPEALTVEEMLDDPRFVDAVVSGARTVEHSTSRRSSTRCRTRC
jgi:hypothetical protein